MRGAQGGKQRCGSDKDLGRPFEFDTPHSNDVISLGDCDDCVRSLARRLGWLEELEALYAGKYERAALSTAAPNPVSSAS